MFFCTLCKLNIPECKKYFHHLKLSHSEVQKFLCGEKACMRKFTTVGSLRCHMYKKHTQTQSIDINKKKVSRLKCSPKKDKRVSKNEVSCNNTRDVSSESERKEELIDLIAKEEHNEVGNSVRSSSNISHAVMFAAQFHDYPDLPRVRTKQIINETAALLANSVEIIRNNVISAVSTGNEDLNLKQKLEEIFEQHRDPFKMLKTEHSCFKTFENHKTFVPPISYLLGERQEFLRQNSIHKLKMHPVTAQFIPLTSVFKIFFQMPQVLNETIAYMESLKKDYTVISNFIQGELWKKLSIDDENKTVLPLIIYFDDYENNNPLGSHKGISKCSAIYALIPCLPPRFTSKLENIFLFVLFNTLDRKYFQDKVIFSKIKDELAILETEGININNGTGQKTIFFRLALITGDNLGLHYMLGFRESFNQEKFCRFCLTNKKDINLVFNENQCELRSECDYDSDLAKNDVKSTGIARECFFYGVGKFHPLINLYVHVVHDVLEGICRYDLGLILNYFIKQKKNVQLTTIERTHREF